ncbi:MAG: pyrroline-5-carboxylate reductase [Lachnospiraceae bacterium]|jgi:pyrroline-5-carboxylate reductase|nr:pyrroline-5-carboxylate reductase [Lachnospiraceae bacterium]
MNPNIGIIGTGNMGKAILCGLLASFGPRSALIVDKDTEKLASVAAETGAPAAAGNADLARRVKYIVLAVKPQFFDGVLADIKDSLTEDHVVVSIAPGITIGRLRDALGAHIKVVRAMPNTPALLGAGMSGVCMGDAPPADTAAPPTPGPLTVTGEPAPDASGTPDRQPTASGPAPAPLAGILTAQERETVRRIFNSFGKMVEVEERLMDAVVCVSGSSPAYAYMLIEALADGGVLYGLPRAQAIEMAAQAVMGAAMMVLQTHEHPAALKDNVCSPGGTTIAAVAALEEYGFRNSVLKATQACHKRTQELK